MAFAFDPDYIAKYKESDVESGKVNADGTINFGSGGTATIITLTYDSDAGEYSSDKSYEEILELATSGAPMVAFYNNGERTSVYVFSGIINDGDDGQCPSFCSIRLSTHDDMADDYMDYMRVDEFVFRSDGTVSSFFETIRTKIWAAENISEITDAPTAEDFNNLINKLIDANLMEPAND